MGTFDAGSIEAKLILDRSQFDRELAQAQAQAARFEGDDLKKTATLNIDSAGAEARIAEIEVELASLGDASVNIDVDSGEAKAKIAALKAELARLRDAHVNVDVDSGDATQKIAVLKTAIDSVPRKKTTTLDVDAGNGVSRTQAFVSAIIAGLALVPPVAAAAAAGVVALAASLTAAAGGAAVLGLGLFGAFKAFQAAQAAGKVMTGSMLVFSNALKGVKAAYNDFVAATQNRAFELMAQGLNIVAGILPRLVPIFNAFATVATSALTGLGNWFNGPEGQGMLRWFQTFGAVQFGVILQILGNLARVILNLLQAFSPLAASMMNGLQQMTAGWVTWSSTISSNRGFQDFIAYVQQVGPMVIAAIGALGAALINIGVALAPLGPPLLSLITNFGNLIASMNPTVLRGIIVVVGALALAWTAFEAVMSVLRAGMAMYSGLLAAVRVATLLWTAAQWLLNVALTANPIGIIIVAIAALVAGLILAWQNSETFRNIVTGAWIAIRAIVGTTITYIIGLVRAFAAIVSTAWAAIVGAITAADAAIIGGVVAAWNAVRNAVSTAVTVIRAVVVTGWNAIRNAVVTAGNAIRSVVVAAWNAVRSAVVSAVNAIRSAVVSGWNAIRSAIVSAMNAIRSNVVSAWNSVRSAVTSAVNAIRSTVVSVWNSIRSSITSAVNSIRSAVSSGFNAARSAAVSAFNSLRSGASSAISGLVGVVSSAVGRIRGFFAGAGSWLWNAGWSIINGLISGIRAGIGALGSALGGIGSFIASHKGPPSYDKVMLRPHGRMIMGGLIRGLNDQMSPLGRTLQGITNTISGINPSLSRLGGGSGGGTIVNVHNYNPIAEKSSVQTTRSMKELAVLGVFG